jgi:hypothetical protein
MHQANVAKARVVSIGQIWPARILAEKVGVAGERRAFDGGLRRQVRRGQRKTLMRQTTGFLA